MNILPIWQPGYLDASDRHGQWQIIVFLVNHPQAATAREAQDVLLEWAREGAS